MNNQYCRHYYISGKVQGVWFRATTKEQAEQIGVTGWVRNLSDGRVEVLACGTAKQLDVLLQWLQKGPPLAEVTAVTVEEHKWQTFIDFDVI